MRPEFEDGVCPVCRDDNCPFGHDHDRQTTWRGPAACLDDAPMAAIVALFALEADPDPADRDDWHWIDEPTVRNVSAHERDQAALRAWQAGTPIPGGMVTVTLADLLRTPA